MWTPWLRWNSICAGVTAWSVVAIFKCPGGDWDNPPVTEQPADPVLSGRVTGKIADWACRSPGLLSGPGLSLTCLTSKWRVENAGSFSRPSSARAQHGTGSRRLEKVPAIFLITLVTSYRDDNNYQTSNNWPHHRNISHFSSRNNSLLLIITATIAATEQHFSTSWDNEVAA